MRRIVSLFNPFTSVGASLRPRTFFFPDILTSQSHGENIAKWEVEAVFYPPFFSGGFSPTQREVFLLSHHFLPFQKIFEPQMYCFSFFNAY